VGGQKKKEVKPVEVEGVEKWEVDKIFGKRRRIWRIQES